jgi:putative nucleotidyltransferase with HDIG domain
VVTLGVLFESPSRVELLALGTMIGIGFLSQSLMYRTTTGAGGAVSLIPFLASIILGPSWLTPVLIGVVVLSGEVRSKRAPLKAAFNIGQFVLAAATAILAFRAAGGVSPLEQRHFTWSLLPALAGASLSFLFVNKAAVAAAIGIHEGGDGWSTWRRLVAGVAAYDLISLPFAYLFARVYSDFGWMWTVVLTVPLIGIRQIYRMNWELQRSSEELLQLLVNAIEARDPYTSGHSKRVAHYATIIAKSVGMKKKVVDRIFTAAILHDVGKIHEDFAPILRKPSTLTPEERAIIESHSERGAQLVSTVSQLEDIVPVIRHHHERWDGRGYPARLAGQDIPLGSRLIMLADTIDAMTSDRPYRAALSKDVVLAELDRMSGIQFDPELTRTFLASNGPAELFEAVASYHESHPPEQDVTRLFDRAKRVRIA